MATQFELKAQIVPYTLSSHTQAVGDVAPRCLGRPHNAHHLAPLHAVVPRHRVRKLYAWQLRVLDLVPAGRNPLCELLGRQCTPSCRHTQQQAVCEDLCNASPRASWRHCNAELS